jgi:hypothetical protein
LRAAFYLALLASMVYSAAQLYVPKAAAFGVCCSFSSQCTDTGHALCCAPNSLEAPCSQSKRNYCSAFCN